MIRWKSPQFVESIGHCSNRCVRRAWLCGCDPLAGREHEHRKRWIEGRMPFPARGFGIDVIGFSILARHFHVVLRNRPDVVATWSDTVVARRWLRLGPIRQWADGSPQEPSAAELGSIRKDPEQIAEIRRRLSDVSWWIRMAAEKMAREANIEEQCSGIERFIAYEWRDELQGGREHRLPG